MGVLHWCSRATASQVSQKMWRTSASLKPTLSRWFICLTTWPAAGGEGQRGKRRSQRIARRYAFKRGGLTFAVLHEDQHLPDAVRHGADGRVQVPDDVFMARQLFLWERPRDQTISNISTLQRPQALQNFFTECKGKSKFKSQNNVFNKLKANTSSETKASEGIVCQWGKCRRAS